MSPSISNVQGAMQSSTHSWAPFNSIISKIFFKGWRLTRILKQFSNCIFSIRNCSETVNILVNYRPSLFTMALKRQKELDANWVVLVH